MTKPGFCGESPQSPNLMSLATRRSPQNRARLWSAGLNDTFSFNGS
ncbi:hypothetical protein LMG6000_01388 [Achromobacter insolitus]|uniref:Uncharacterized protein n=1 Tax=Achromobacter insolitus TaxID=217204 RepID=A0A6S7EXV0_9BURK|nr:hypothetical protein LMG6000_01388 [Achromobacter insolitus]CAB3933401.1 hypothetical protein LMG5997_01276 [Achromobacter insolitus]